MQTAIKCVIKHGRLGETDEIMNLEEPGTNADFRIRKVCVTEGDRTNYNRKESEEEGDRGGVTWWQANPALRGRSGTGGKKRARGQYAGGGVETSSAQVLLPAQLGFQKVPG